MQQSLWKTDYTDPREYVKNSRSITLCIHTHSNATEMGHLPHPEPPQNSIGVEQQDNQLQFTLWE